MRTWQADVQIHSEKVGICRLSRLTFSWQICRTEWPICCPVACTVGFISSLKPNEANDWQWIMPLSGTGHNNRHSVRPVAGNGSANFRRESLRPRTSQCGSVNGMAAWRWSKLWASTPSGCDVAESARLSYRWIQGQTGETDGARERA